MDLLRQSATSAVGGDRGRAAIVALDVGEKRIGVAVAAQGVWLASPHTTVINDGEVWRTLRTVLDGLGAAQIVVGLPRNLSGDDTPQTEYVRTFAQEFTAQVGLSVVFQDEALTSRRAEEELRARGKPYAKGDIDALAATYILEDYIRDQRV